MKRPNSFETCIAIKHNNCSNLHTREMINQGWGSDFGGIFRGLAYGMEQHRPVQFWLPGNSAWIYTVGPQAVVRSGTTLQRQFINQHAAQQTPACPSTNMECYFLPLCGCPILPGTVIEQRFDPATTHLDTEKGGWYLEYATRTRTFLRHRIYQFLADSAATSLIRTTPCTVIHVRRADIVINPWGNATRRYHPMEDYINAAAGRDDMILHDNILLLTDDENAISEARFKYPQYHWMVLNRTRHVGARGGFENQIPSGDPVDVVALLAEITLATRHCTAIVHTFSSLAYYLRAAMQAAAAAHHGTTIVKLDINDALHASNSVWKVGNAGSLNISRSYGGAI
jgi:hypothetical protein